MADKKEKQSGEESKKPINIKAILLGAFAVLNFLVVGAGGYLVYASTVGYKAPVITQSSLKQDQLLERQQRGPASESTEGQPHPLLLYTMDKFTVNLSGFPQRTIRVEVNLEMLESDGYVEVMTPENRAKARDRIVRLLNDKTFEELESIQGKLFLKDKIVAEVNNILDKGVVKDVYFSEFVVQ